jgi:hypothetical protein
VSGINLKILCERLESASDLPFRKANAAVVERVVQQLTIESQGQINKKKKSQRLEKHDGKKSQSEEMEDDAESMEECYEKRANAIIVVPHCIICSDSRTFRDGLDETQVTSKKADGLFHHRTAPARKTMTLMLLSQPSLVVLIHAP